MKKKVLFGTFLALAALVTVPMLAAWEAHVVNVTAQIENALSVTTEHIDFGTVFPQEHLFRSLDVSLSQSFLDEDRVDDVEYFIRQKPKCGVTTLDGRTLLEGSTATGHVRLGDNPNTVEVETHWIDCGEAPIEFNAQTHVYGVLPSLCEYISKEGEDQNDDTLPSFHIPWTISTTTGTSTINWLDTHGRLAKSDQDLTDRWTIDLAVPCFGGHCAQDWESFVLGINPEADPAEFMLDPEDEHKVFGCDLWIEVGGISTSTATSTPGNGTLTVVKTVINNNGGTSTPASFPLFVDGNPVSSGASTTVSAGVHTVSETGMFGYEATFGGDCAANGTVNVPAGGSATCTITNDDIAPTITLIKTVIGGTAAPDDFDLSIDGAVVTSGSSNPVSAGVPHAIDEEVLVEGYAFVSITGSPQCPAILGGSATLGLDESITCTITNEFDEIE
jgi:hypothetical protein